jgi:hypothetical protein
VKGFAVKGCLGDSSQEFEAKVRELLEETCRKIESRVRVRSIVLFGSCARKRFRDFGDIDLIIISDEFPESYSKRLDLIQPAFKEVKHGSGYRELREMGARLTFNPVAYRSSDLHQTPPLLLDVAEDGIILRDDGLMRDKLEDLRARLRQLGARRVWTKRGSWYWVLKPDWKPGEVIEI